MNGTNSYIKCDTSDWMVQGAEELTVSEWAYMDDWTTSVAQNAHIWSCTESGGFNTENITTGKLRIPICVFNSSEQTTYAYINTGSDIAGFYVASLSPGWHMFSFTYTTSEIKSYIDGVLHENISITSYGIKYNTAARLFLGCEAAASAPTAPYFNGKLSDFRLYYTALTADEIADLYHTSSSITSNGTLLTSEVNET